MNAQFRAKTRNCLVKTLISVKIGFQGFRNSFLHIDEQEQKTKLKVVCGFMLRRE